MFVAGALLGYEWIMTPSLTQDSPGRGAGCPRSDYFVEWQITDAPGTFIDLAADGENEMLLAEDTEVGSTSGH